MGKAESVRLVFIWYSIYILFGSYNETRAILSLQQ